MFGGGKPGLPARPIGRFSATVRRGFHHHAFVVHAHHVAPGARLSPPRTSAERTFVTDRFCLGLSNTCPQAGFTRGFGLARWADVGQT